MQEKLERKFNQPSLIMTQENSILIEDALLYSNLTTKFKFRFDLVKILRLINSFYIQI